MNELFFKKNLSTFGHLDTKEPFLKNLSPRMKVQPFDRYLFKIVLGPPRAAKVSLWCSCPALHLARPDGFKEITHEGHNRVNRHWAVLKTKSEGLPSHSHNERTCVSVMDSYSLNV